jgi:hypothetical protein
MRHPATFLLFACLTVFLGAVDGSAQEAVQDKAPLTRVTVRLLDRADRIKGELISLGPDAVRLRVKDEEMTIPLDRVQEVRTGADSVLDGALKGAALGAIVCVLGCGQGADSPGQVPFIVMGAAFGYGGIGALIDWAHPNRETLFPQR